MNAHSPPPFTPAQVLEAARRAEREGRNEYALQFYRHLANSYPDTPEGAAAQSALMQLAPQPSFGVAPMPEPQGQSGYTLGNPFASAPAPEFGTAPHLQAGYQHAPAPTAQTRPPAIAAIELPAPARDYRMGRFLARLATWFGGMSLIAGIGLVPLSLLGPKALTGLPLVGPLLATGPKLGLQLAVAGVVQMVVGQLVRALLDQANATRDMAAITRAQAEALNPTEPRSGRRKRR